LVDIPQLSSSGDDQANLSFADNTALMFPNEDRNIRHSENVSGPSEAGTNDRNRTLEHVSNCRSNLKRKHEGIDEYFEFSVFNSDPENASRENEMESSTARNCTKIDTLLSSSISSDQLQCSTQNSTLAGVGEEESRSTPSSSDLLNRQNDFNDVTNLPQEGDYSHHLKGYADVSDDEVVLVGISLNPEKRFEPKRDHQYKYESEQISAKLILRDLASFLTVGSISIPFAR
jgi:hypothetical protein